MASALLDEIVAFAGFNAALELCRGWGGRVIYVPKSENMDQAHPIALAIGLTNARELSHRYGGEHLAIPAERNALLELRNAHIVAKYRDAGASVSALSLEYGIHRKMVATILDRAGVQRRREGVA